MSDRPSYEELDKRISADLGRDGFDDRATACWHGYLAALLEWGLISVEQHRQLSDRLPATEEQPRRSHPPRSKRLSASAADTRPDTRRVQTVGRRVLSCSAVAPKLLRLHPDGDDGNPVVQSLLDRGDAGPLQHRLHDEERRVADDRLGEAFRQRPCGRRV